MVTDFELRDEYYDGDGDLRQGPSHPPQVQHEGCGEPLTEGRRRYCDGHRAEMDREPALAGSEL